MCVKIFYYFLNNASMKMEMLMYFPDTGFISLGYISRSRTAESFDRFVLGWGILAVLGRMYCAVLGMNPVPCMQSVCSSPWSHLPDLNGFSLVYLLW